MIPATIHLPDQIKAIVTTIDTALYNAGAFPYHVYFLDGHPMEIVKVLQEKLQGDNKDKRFPLVALLQDTKIQRSKDTSFYGETNIQLIICTVTKPEYRSEQRRENVFKPILYPIYEALLNEIESCEYFNFDLNGVEHTQTDRYYWGREGLYGNTGNQFNDYIDAIEIEIPLKIELKQDCKPLSNF
jgi:hypothetical protein